MCGRWRWVAAGSAPVPGVRVDTVRPEPDCGATSRISGSIFQYIAAWLRPRKHKLPLQGIAVIHIRLETSADRIQPRHLVQEIGETSTVGVPFLEDSVAGLAELSHEQ